MIPHYLVLIWWEVVSKRVSKRISKRISTAGRSGYLAFCICMVMGFQKTPNVIIWHVTPPASTFLHLHVICRCLSSPPSLLNPSHSLLIPICYSLAEEKKASKLPWPLSDNKGWDPGTLPSLHAVPNIPPDCTPCNKFWSKNFQPTPCSQTPRSSAIAYRTRKRRPSRCLPVVKPQLRSHLHRYRCLSTSDRALAPYKTPRVRRTSNTPLPPYTP